MKLIDKIGSALKWPLKRLDKAGEELIRDKTDVAIHQGLVTLDRLAPVLTDVLAGRKVKIHTVTEVWLEENPEDTK